MSKKQSQQNQQSNETSNVQDSHVRTSVDVAALNLLGQGLKRNYDPQAAIRTLLEATGKEIANVLDSEIKDGQKKIEEKKTSKAKDSVLSNPVTSTGSFDKISQYNKFGLDLNIYNYPLWMALYMNSWVFRRGIDKPAKDIVKLPIVINSDINEDVKNKILRDVRLLSPYMTNLFKWGGLFGGSVAILMFDTFDDKDYTEPISSNIQKIKASKVVRMYVTDRWYGVSPSSTNVTTLTSLDYGKPESYSITFANGTQKTIHHDYVLRYEHRDAPQLMKQGYLQGWGLPEGVHLFDELSRDAQLKADITSLVNKSLIEVIKMDGMRGIFMGTDAESQRQLDKRLEMVNWARSFNSLTLLDGQDDYIQNTYGGLGGLADLLEKNMWLVSAAFEMQGVLYGDLKQGFSNDVDALARYDDVIQTRADELCRTCYHKLLNVLFIKHEVGDIPVDFEFGSLLTQEKTDKKQKKVDEWQGTLSRLFSDGVISAKQYLDSLHKFIVKDVITLDITEQTIKEAEERIKAEEEIPGLGDM